MRQRLSWDYDKMAAASNSLRREISEDFKYNKKKLKHLKHILHNVTVALGTLVSSLNEFSRLKGRDISPDGLLGGLGYIIPIKGIKEALIHSVQQLGDIADCIADELTNPRWNAEDDSDVKKLLKQKEEVEEQVEEQMEEEISPEDVITSTNEDLLITKEAEDAYADAVRRRLVIATGVKS